MIGPDADGRLEGRGDSCVGAAVDGEKVGDLDIGAVDDGIALGVDVDTSDGNDDGDGDDDGLELRLALGTALGVDVDTSDGGRNDGNGDDDGDDDDGLELRLALGSALGVDVDTIDGDDDGLELGTIDDGISVDDEGARDTAVTGDTDGACVGAAVDVDRVGDLDIGAVDDGNVVLGALEGARDGVLLGGCTFVGCSVGSSSTVGENIDG